VWGWGGHAQAWWGGDGGEVGGVLGGGGSMVSGVIWCGEMGQGRED
jgi:hypothetical protein